MSSPISIVFHSGFGHTARLAQAVAEGSGGTLLAIDSHGELPPEGWDRLAAARAIVFGSPTCMGNVSWQFKKFADASSPIWARQGWKDKLAAGFTHSAGLNGDKLAALHAVFTLAQQHGMLWAGTGMLPASLKASKRDDLNYLAPFAGPMAASPADAGADELAPGDLETARAFGHRVADLVRRFD